MRLKITTALIILMGGLLFSSSCSKDEETLIEPIKTTITTSIDGTTWKTEDVISIKSGGEYFITAIKGDESLIIRIPEITADTFVISTGNPTAAVYSLDDTDPIKIYNAGSGSVIITKVNATDFDATFSFSTKNAIGQKKEFTNGNMIKITIPL